MKRVLIYGASGFTGKLVARALRDDGDFDLVLAGRTAEKLEALAGEIGRGDVRVAAAHEIDKLKEIFADVDVVVNCSGPFSRLGEPVVRASIAANAHYLDTTGEQHFMRDMYERYDSAARKAGVCVVNSFAFEIALGDWLVARAAAALDITHEAPADEVAVGYAMDHFKPTRGTRLSAIESIAGPGVVWRRDRWESTPPAVERRSIGFPPPVGSRTSLSFPSGEVITVPRHVPARYVQTFVSFGDRGLSGLLPKLTGLLGSSAGSALARLARSGIAKAVQKRIAAGPEGPTDGQRAADDFGVAAEVVRGFDKSFAAILGTDVYGVTAEVVAYGVRQLVSHAPRATGVCAPSQAFDPIAALDEMIKRCGLQLQASQ